MLFFENQRRPSVPAYALSSVAAVATLAQLREQAFPQPIAPPAFVPRPRRQSTRPTGLTSVWRHVSRQATLAGTVAALVLLAASALPAWAALEDDAEPPPLRPAHTSVGATGTSATRVEDLGVSTFLGNLPFVQEAQYLNTVTGAVPEADRFVAGAREATVAEYLQNINWQVSLPYLTHGIASKKAIDGWNVAVGETMKKQAAEEARKQAASAGPFQSHSLATYHYGGGQLAAGTRIPGTTITFYACIGNGFCGNMASGQPVFAGAAACSADLAFGTRFVIANDPSGRTFVCLDRGALSSPWVDVWFYDAADGYAWQSFVGSVGDIIIVE